MEDYVFNEISDPAKALNLYKKGALFVKTRSNVKLFEKNCKINYFIDIANQEGRHKFLSMKYKKLSKKNSFYRACSNNRTLFTPRGNSKIESKIKNPKFESMQDLDSIHFHNNIYISVNKKDVIKRGLSDINIAIEFVTIVKK